jgi:translation initiation factor 4G
MILRPARTGDSAFLAWAILTAARSHLPKGWFDVVLDRPERDCLDFLRRLALTKPPSWWHYSRFCVAERAGEPVGALCTFRAGDAYPLSQQALAEAAESLSISAADQAAMWRRGAYLFTCVLDANDDAWTIENVATVPSQRGKGVAGPRACGRARPGCRALDRADHVPDRQRSRRACLREGGLQLREREAQ